MWHIYLKILFIPLKMEFNINSTVKEMKINKKFSQTLTPSQSLTNHYYSITIIPALKQPKEYK